VNRSLFERNGAEPRGPEDGFPFPLRRAMRAGQIGILPSGALPSAQRGVILMTALVFLVIVTVLGIMSMRSSTVGVRMARNEESRVAGAQAAQGLTEQILAMPSNTPVIGGPGYSNCTAGVSGCDLYSISVSSSDLAALVDAGALTAEVTRLTPSDKPPPRVVESSLDKFSAAGFQVTATYDRTDDGLGRTQVVEGLLMLVPIQ
jgi:hypothetical protein